MKMPKSPAVDVEVTQEIITSSVTADSSHCMIAEAVKAARPDAKSISVDIQTIRFSDPAKRVRYAYLTPRCAQIPLIQFDEGILPEPFSFKLRGGHVYRMGDSRPKTAKAIDANDKRRVALSKGHKSQEALAKAGLVARQTGKRPTAPERVGGAGPPMTSFANIRAFGLRGLRIPRRAST